MKYQLTLKNEGHDIDDLVRADTFADAVRLFSDKHDMDVHEIVHNVSEVEDQPAEYQNE